MGVCIDHVRLMQQAYAASASAGSMRGKSGGAAWIPSVATSRP
jgi:hypothetical protein